MAKGPGKLDILMLGPPKDDDEADESPKALACKALFKAIKANDETGFESALSDYLDYRESSDVGAESDD
jgi:hypothetical protein